MFLSQRNKVVNEPDHRRRVGKKHKPSVRLFIEELEARSVPSISASGTTIAGTEGISITGVGATFTDTDAGATVNNFTTSIVWGDGTTSTGTVQATANGFQVTGSHTYTDEGSPSVAVTVNDIDGSSATATSTAQIADNDALTATGYNLSGIEGQAVNGIVATFTDATYPTNSPGDFTANITWGDGSSSVGTVGSQGNLFVVRGSHTYAEKGAYSISVAIQDDGAGVASASTTSAATIADAPLTATGVPQSATEGQTLFASAVATFSDGNPNATASDFTAMVDWGNGTASQEAVAPIGNGMFRVSLPGGSFEIPGQIPYSEEGQFTITTTITDIDGSKAIATSTATVADAPLTVTANPIHAVEGVAFSGQVATFTDANPNATIIDDFIFPPPGSGIEVQTVTNAIIDWGDGTTLVRGFIPITQPGGVGTPFIVSAGHTYAKAGSYTISVTILDNGGSETTTSTTATVTDPDDIVGRVGQNGQIWTGVSTGSSFNTSLWGTLDPKVTWVDTVTGDFNGDGRTDIAARNLATGQWWVAVSTGSSFTASVWDSWSPKVTWTDVQVGDFNGDGKADIIGRPVGTGDWWVATSTGSSFTNSLWDRWSPSATWVDAKVGDFDGDGKADITARDLHTGAWWTGVSTGSSFNTSLWAIWSTAVTWVDVQVGDFNGDGFADIAGRALETGQWWVGFANAFNGEPGPVPPPPPTAFSTAFWNSWSTAVAWVDVKVGDFNGDGSTDIIGRALQTGQWWVNLSPFHPCGKGACFVVVSPPPAVLFATWSTAVTWVDIQVGDFNGDGKLDITGRALQTGQWWTGLSTGSAFTTSLWGTWSTAVTWTGVRGGDFA